MQDYQRLLEKAEQLIDDHQFGEALQLLNQAFQQKPDEAEPLIRMAFIFKELGDIGGAIDLLRKASQIGSPNAYVLLKLGILLYGESRLGEAEVALEEAVAVIRHGIASVREELNASDVENSAAVLAQCDELEVTAGQAMELLNVIRSGDGQAVGSGTDAGTGSDVEQFIPEPSTPAPTSMQPNGPSGTSEAAVQELLETGAAFLREGKSQKAAACFERVIALDENNLRARLNLGNILYVEGLRSEALVHVAHGRDMIEKHLRDLSSDLPGDEETVALAEGLRALLDEVNRMHDQIRLRLMFADSAANRIDPLQVQESLPLLESDDTVRIGVLITLWQRHALADLVLSRCKAIKERVAPHVELELLAVGSEGAVTRTLAENNGFTYVEQPNDPLGAKRNAGLRALRDYDLDAVAFVDSDDFVCDRLFTTYAVGLRAGYAVLGLLDMYILDLANLRACYWPGYGRKGGRQGETLGLGRCISRPLLDDLGWKLWDDSLNRRLDGSMIEHLAGRLLANPEQYPIGTISCTEHDLTAVDVKTETNLWSFDQMVAVLDHARHVPPMDVVGTFFNPEEAARLLSMSTAADRIHALLESVAEVDGLAA